MKPHPCIASLSRSITTQLHVQSLACISTTPGSLHYYECFLCDVTACDVPSYISSTPLLLFPSSQLCILLISVRFTSHCRYCCTVHLVVSFPCREEEAKREWWVEEEKGEVGCWVRDKIMVTKRSVTCESTVILLLPRSFRSLVSWALGEIGGLGHICLVCSNSLQVKDQSSVLLLLAVTCYKSVVSLSVCMFILARISLRHCA